VESPAAEGDYATPRVVNGYDYPVAKTIVGDGNIITCNKQSGVYHVVRADTLFSQMLLQCKAIGRRIPNSKFDPSPCENSPVVQIGTRASSALGGETCFEERRGNL